jgi:hypothetical protein
MLIAAFLATLAIGQTVPSRDCRDDNLRDRCAAEDRARVEEMLGIAPIETEAESGAEVYRARYVDGYGRDMPAVAFTRRPGQDPMVEVSGRDGRKMTTLVDPDVWDAVVADSRFADRALAPLAEPARADGAPPIFEPICLHAWVVSVEMANTQIMRNKTKPVRRATQSACGGELTVRYAFDLAKYAVEALAPCQLLDENKQRNHLTILATCLELEGDRFAAATLWNRQSEGRPRYGLDVKDPGVWRSYLGTNGSPTLDWQGEVMTTERGRDNRVAETLVARLNETPMSFLPVKFRGLSRTRAELEGVVEAEGGRVAPYRQTWIWDPNLSEWMLERWTVEPFSVTD